MDFAFFYLLSFLSGYAFWNISALYFPLKKKNDTFSKFILYGVTGLIVLVIVLFLLSFFMVSSLILIAIFCLLFAFFMFKEWNNIRCFKKLRPNLTICIPIGLFLISFVYFAYAVSFLGWPPPGDIMSRHGPMVSLINYNGKMPWNLYPLANVSIDYPLGFHVFTAFLGKLWVVYPAQAVLIVGGGLISMLPVLLYLLTFGKTASFLLATTTFFYSFYIHPSNNMEKWPIGYFFNGPFPCLLTFVLVIGIIAIFEYVNSYLHEYNEGFLILVGLWGTVAVILVYPPFSISILLFLIVRCIRNSFINSRQRTRKLFNRKSKIYLLLNIILLAIVLALNFSVYPMFSVFLRQYSSWSASYSQAYMLQLEDFSNYLGVIIIFAVPIAVYDLFKKPNNTPIFFLILLLLTVLSFIPPLTSYVAMTFPSRNFVILALLAWVIIATFLEEVIRKTLAQRKMSTHQSAFKKCFRTQNLAVGIVAIMILSLLAPSLYLHFTGGVANTLGWFPHSDYFADDFAALEWIEKHIPNNALILNDRSYISLYLLSFSIKNLTFNYYTVTYTQKLDLTLMQIWTNPSNISRELLKTYDVKYILLTSEQGYLTEPRLEGDYKYVPKIHSNDIYTSIFDSCPFLKKSFASGKSRVYEVIQ